MDIQNLTDQGQLERQILCEVITNSEFLKHLSPLDDYELFSTKTQNLLTRWSVDYYDEYKKAPGDYITFLFEKWSKADYLTDEEVTLIEEYLSDLNDEYNLEGDVDADEANLKYLLTETANIFNRTIYLRLERKAKEHRSLGEYDAAVKEMNAFQERKIDFFENDLTLVHFNTFAHFHDEWIESLSEKNLLRYPGAAKDFLSPFMRRGDFVCFVGPDKSGKSYFLVDAACRAIKRKLKVAYFDCGDLSKREVITRFMRRIGGLTEYPVQQLCVHKENEPLWIRPKGALLDGTHVFASEWFKYHGHTFFDEISPSNTQSRLRVVSHPSDTISLDMIQRNLDQWEIKDDWKADIVVIDYADIMKTPNKKDNLAEIDALWAGLRALSLQNNILVLTATQSDANAYNQFLLNRGNFSGRKTKNAHVTGMIGINIQHRGNVVEDPVTGEPKEQPSEKSLGRCRLNWLVLRHGTFSETDYITCAGNLGIGNPIIASW